MKKTTLLIFAFVISLVTLAQQASPVVTYIDKKTLEVDTLTDKSEALSAEAPLDITMHTVIDCPWNYTYQVEWKIYSETEGESSPVLDRFVEESDYTMTKNGTFCIKLIASFFGINNDTVTIECDPIRITIAESKLTCPDGFSPNGDGINDNLVITCKSLVSVKGTIFNRWGQKIKSLNLDSLVPVEDEEEKYVIWDGMIGGKAAKDGVYFINLDARGSDGVHYKIKKAVNILKGYREDTDGGTDN